MYLLRFGSEMIVRWHGVILRSATQKAKVTADACPCGKIFTAIAAVPIQVLTLIALLVLLELAWLEVRSSGLSVLGTTAVVNTFVSGLIAALHSSGPSTADIIDMWKWQIQPSLMCTCPGRTACGLVDVHCCAGLDRAPSCEHPPA